MRSVFMDMMDTGLDGFWAMNVVQHGLKMMTSGGTAFSTSASSLVAQRGVAALGTWVQVKASP